MKNIEERTEEFSVDKQIIEEFISLVKPFRHKANSTDHSIIMIGDETQVIALKIERMVDLLLKIKSNITNDLIPRT